MARQQATRMRCRRCGMPHVDAATTCAACEADLTLPGALELVGGVSGRAGRAAPADAPQARRQAEVAAAKARVLDALARPATDDAAAAAALARRRAAASQVTTQGAQPAEPQDPELTDDVPAVPGGAPADRAGSRRALPPVVAPRPRLGRLWLAMDEQSRRTMIRLAIEVLLLIGVVALVAVNTVGRSRPAATASPAPSTPGIVAGGAGLGIAAEDITAVFGLPYGGGFAFQAAGTGADARLEGRSADGAATLDLHGPRLDVTKVVLAMRVVAGSGDEGIARQRVMLLLVLYCPGAIDQLLASLDESLAARADVTTAASCDGVEARLETRVASGGGASLTLLPVAAPGAQPTAGPARSGGSAAPSPGASRQPTVAPTPSRAPTPAPTPTPRTTPRPS